MADVAAVELHTLDHLDIGAEALPFLNLDYAIATDLVHGIGNEVADLLILGRNAGYLGHAVAALDGRGQLVDALNHQLRRLLDAFLDDHRVGPGGDHVHPLHDHRVGQHHAGGGAVAGDVVGLGGDLLEQLRAHVFEAVLELDVASDRDSIVGDHRAAVLLVQDDIAAVGAKGDADDVGQLARSAPQVFAG